jgi:hypothetical protein
MAATVLIRLLAAAGCVLAVQAHAQPAPASNQGALRRISGACQAETARYCPALAQSAPSPREQYICLKSYKSSLSFNCRGAVNGAAPH